MLCLIKMRGTLKLFFLFWATLAVAERPSPARTSFVQLHPCLPIFEAFGTPSDFDRTLKLLKSVPDSNPADPAMIAEKAELVEMLIKFADSDLLSKAEREAIHGRLENLSFAKIGVQRRDGVTQHAAAQAAARAEATAIYFFRLHKEGIEHERELGQDPVDWLSYQLKARDWSPEKLKKQAELSAAEFALVSKMLSPENGAAAPDPLFVHYLMGRLVPFFAQRPIDALTLKTNVQTDVPAGSSFIDFVQSENAKRGWDVQTLRFLALQRSDVALLEQILAGTETLENQKPHVRARIIAQISRAHAAYPAGSETGAPKQGETISGWLKRELANRGYSPELSAANSPFWTDLNLGIPAHRQEVLSALSGESTEFFPYVRTKLLKFFRANRR